MIKAIDKPLTLKQEQFVANYLESSNAYQAAIKAGYKETTAIVHSGHMLENVRIKAKIDAYRLKLSEKVDLSIESRARETQELLVLAKNNNHLSSAGTFNDQLNRIGGCYNADTSQGLSIVDIMAVVGIAVEGTDKP